MQPTYPYPNITTLQKRTAVGTEKTHLHKYTLSYDRMENTTARGAKVDAGQYASPHMAQLAYGINSNHRPGTQLYAANPPPRDEHAKNYITPDRNNPLYSTNSSASTSSFDNALRPSSHSDTDPYTSSYESIYPLYSLDWTSSHSDPYAKVALSSYREDFTNKLEILYGIPDSDEDEPRNTISPTSTRTDSMNTHTTGTARAPRQGHADSWNFVKCFDYRVKYPITRVQWDPAMYSRYSGRETLATTSECLRIYQVVEDADDSADRVSYDNSSHISNKLHVNHHSKLIEKAALTNSKSTNLNQLPPMSSFDWNRYDPTQLITCSIDTTCTAWNLVKETFVAKTQLIAHDSEVYDVKYINKNANVFASCSSDGSVRLFDLRNLEQSTIIYEISDSNNNNYANMANGEKPSSKIVRLAPSNYNTNQIAVLKEDCNSVLILDLRNVGVPIYVLDHHKAPVNTIAWHPTQNRLLSGADDCQVLIYDFADSDSSAGYTDTNQDKSPDYRFQTEMEVNYACWSPSGDWVGINNGKQFQACKF